MSLYVIGGVIVVFLYYLIIWSRIGRDPPKGTEVPRWDPPENISPAMVHYIHYRGLQTGLYEALSAALVSLAVKGYLVLEGFDKTLTFTRTDKQTIHGLPTGENALLKALGEPGDKFLVTKKSGTRLNTMISRFRTAIENEHRNMFFRVNGAYCVSGAALSVLVFAGILLLSGQFNEKMLVLLAGAGFFAFVFGTIIIKILQLFKSRRGVNWMVGLVFIPITVIAISQSSMLLYIAEQMKIDQPVPLIGLGLLIMINIVFAKIMTAPTPIGRQIMDHIEGLRLYLKLAEADRMNLAGAPRISPRHFEKMLPYAIALKLEEPWSDTFDKWLKSATSEELANVQSLRWSGTADFSRRRLVRHISKLSGSLQSNIRSAMPKPKLSSTSGRVSFRGRGSSGGFSGGGGGGLGGGGW